MKKRHSRHGKDHLPDGFDPIPGLTLTPGGSGTGLPVAFMNRSQASMTVGSGSSPLDFGFVSWNDDDVFGYDGVTGTAPNKKARYLVCTPGTYMIDVEVNWTTAFTSGDSPAVRPSVSIGGTPDLLANTVDVRSMNDADDEGIWNIQNADAGELAHLALRATCIFSWDEDLIGETTMGVGVDLFSSNARTKTVGAGLSLVRLGDAAAEQTIS